MEDSARAQVTALLLEWGKGDRAALDRLMPLVYEELRRVARARLRGDAQHHSLQTTTLVHEAYVRLVDLDRMSVNNRAHFFALAAHLMRQILVDHARRVRASKRGGDVSIVALEEAAQQASARREVDVLALDEALGQLAAHDVRVCRVVELRFFAGMTIDETAAALGLSAATVERDWAFAKAWLHGRLS